MGDPAAPRGWPRTNRESRTPLEQFVARLTDLGASDDEISAVVETWDDVAPADGNPETWTAKRRDDVARLPDIHLRKMIEDGREEFEYATTTQEEADAKAAALASERAYSEAGDRIEGNVASIRSWVGSDAVRAAAVLQWEEAPNGANRATLTRPLNDMLGFDG